MRRAVSTSLALAFLLALRPPMAGEEKGKARVDLFGDPLPEGALARLGTLRLRQEAPIRALAFTPDGKSLITGGFGRGLVFWDVDSGKERRRLALTNVTSLALSADGKVLAVGGADGAAHVLDAANGAERKLLREEPRRFGATFVALSPDGKSALVATQHSRDVVLWDVAEARARHRLSLANGTATRPPMAFTPDGKAFVLTLDDDRLHVLDALTGRDLRTLAGSAPPAGTGAHNRIQALAISADGKYVAFGGRASNELVVLDLASGKEARRLSPRAGPVHHGATHSLAFTPDGRFLVEGGGNGVSVWGVASGKLLRRFPGGEYSAPGAPAPLALSPDGKSIAVASGNVLSLRSLADGKLRHAGAGHAGAVGRIAFSADGKRLLSSGDALRLWDADSGKQLEVLPFDYTLHHLYPTRDGKGFRWVAFDRSLYEWRPGEREPRRLSAPSMSVYYAASTISPDGNFLAGLTSDDHKLWLLPLRENRPPRQLDVLPDPWSTYLTFSPDGRRLALVNSQRMLRVYDVTAAREPRSWPPEPGAFGLGSRVEFSPDGRSLVRFDGEARCLEVASGLERFRLPRDGPGPQVTGWSPDGRLLAWARFDGSVVVHDTCTGREVLRRNGKQGRVVSLAFSPDGRKLATGGANTTILLWEVPAPPPVKGPLDRAAAWRDLAGDGARSFRAMAALLSAPDEAVALVRAKVRPQPPADPKRLAALIAVLNDDSFEARERAEEELRKLGVAAEAALRQALKNRALEVRRRAANLLAELEGAGPERLRAVRALEVLERARTPAARALLRQMAKAGFDSFLEGEIQASLERLGE
jgi:WD40 repeat protein